MPWHHFAQPFLEISMNVALKLSGLMFAMAGSLGLAQASVLPADSATTSVDIVPTFFGGTLLDAVTTNIHNAAYSGVARAAVYETASGMDFYYQFSNAMTSQTGVERFGTYDFSSLGSNAAVSVYQTAAPFGIFQAGAEAADYADHTRWGVVGFNFVPNDASRLDPGTTSYIEIVHTNAHNYTTGTFALIGGMGDNAQGFEPSAVPEPTTRMLMLVGLAFCGLKCTRSLKVT